MTEPNFSLYGYGWAVAWLVFCFLLQEGGHVSFFPPMPLHLGLLYALQKGSYCAVLCLFFLGGLLYDVLWARPLVWLVGECFLLFVVFRLYRHFFRPTFLMKTALFWVMGSLYALFHTFSKDWLLQCSFLYSGVILQSLYDAWKKRTQLVGAG